MPGNINQLTCLYSCRERRYQCLRGFRGLTKLEYHSVAIFIPQRHQLQTMKLRLCYPEPRFPFIDCCHSLQIENRCDMYEKRYYSSLKSLSWDNRSILKIKKFKICLQPLLSEFLFEHSNPVVYLIKTEK